MVMDILRIKTRAAVGICSIAKAKDPGLWNVVGKKVLEPERLAVGSGPGFLRMAIESMDGNNAIRVV
jgi:hypothetical protein